MDTNNNQTNGQPYTPQYDPQTGAPLTDAAQQGYPAYQTPPGQQPMNGPVTINNYAQPPQEMTIGRWILTLFLVNIPLVGFIMLIIWAVSSSQDNRSRKNWAIAQFIWTLIIIVLFIVIVLVTGLSLSSLMQYGY